MYASVDFGPSISTINGQLYIFSGGAVINNAPIYGANSSLTYGSGGTYARGLEWSATSGAGAPYNVSVYQNTTLNYASGNPAANSIPGSLQINSGTFDMGTANSPLTVGGSVAIFGTLTLSSVPGGDLRVLGGYWYNDGGTFNSNGRTVTLESTSNSHSIRQREYDLRRPDDQQLGCRTWSKPGQQPDGQWHANTHQRTGELGRLQPDHRLR